MGDFVRPKVERLFLVDVHRRTLAEHVDNIQKLSRDLTEDGRAKYIAAQMLTPVLETRLKRAEQANRWIDVKKRLNAGESRKMYARIVKEMPVGETPQLDPEQVGHTKLLAYVLGWSFTDDEGRPVPFSPAALDNVDPDVYVEMIKAIDQHEESQEQARSAEKNGISDGVIVSSATSLLLSGAAGASSGFVS